MEVSRVRGVEGEGRGLGKFVFDQDRAARSGRGVAREREKLGGGGDRKGHTARVLT